MSRAVLILANEGIRIRAIEWIRKAPRDTRVEFKAPKRTLPQNALMWVYLTKIARQIEWHGQKLSPDDWKILFMDALNKELRFVPNINGNGFVNLGRSSSDLSVPEMADLVTLIEAFAANHNVNLDQMES